MIWETRHLYSPLSTRGHDSMSDEESTEGIVESPLSQNTYVMIWAIGSLASLVIFIVYF